MNDTKCTKCRTYACIDAHHCTLMVETQRAGSAIDAWLDGAIGTVPYSDFGNHKRELFRAYHRAAAASIAYAQAVK